MERIKKKILVLTSDIFSLTASKTFMFTSHILSHIGIDLEFNVKKVCEYLGAAELWSEDVDMMVGYDVMEDDIKLLGDSCDYIGTRYSKSKQCNPNTLNIDSKYFIPTATINNIKDINNVRNLSYITVVLKRLSDSQYMYNKFIIKGQYGARCLQNVIIHGLELFPTDQRSYDSLDTIIKTVGTDNPVIQPLYNFRSEYRVIIGLNNFIIYTRDIRDNRFVSNSSLVCREIKITDLTDDSCIVELIHDIQNSMINNKSHISLSVDIGVVDDNSAYLIEYQMEVPSNNPSTRGVYWSLLAKSLLYVLGMPDHISKFDNKEVASYIDKISSLGHIEPIYGRDDSST